MVIKFNGKQVVFPIDPLVPLCGGRKTAIVVAKSTMKRDNLVDILDEVHKYTHQLPIRGIDMALKIKKRLHERI